MDERGKEDQEKSASSMFSKQTHYVCECALDSARLTWMLVTLLNIFLQKGYYPKRQLNLVETTLEKRKGLVLEKLSSVTLIEGDLQISMRTLLNSDKEELIEGDKHLSKANYGLQKNFTMTSALLKNN